MKDIQKRKLLQIILGFLLGRVELFGMNPVGIAFFVACYMEKGAKLPVGISVLLGMATVFSMDRVISSLVIMVTVLLVLDFMEKQKIALRMGHAVFFLAAAMGAMTVLKYYLLPPGGYDIALGVLETVLSAAAVRVLYEGQHFLLNGRQGQNLGNEEMVSLILTGAFVVLGFPREEIFGMIPGQIIVYLVTLVMGYIYGTGTGAVTGTVFGCVLAVMGQDANGIGMLALLGICAGALREQGRMLLCVSFFVGRIFLGYLLEPKMFTVEEWGSVAVAGGIFLVLPVKLLQKVPVNAGGWSEHWESQQFQEMVRYKLQDFAHAFQKLSAVLQKEREDSFDGERVRQMLSVMSDEICGHCGNYERCGGHIALLQPEMLGEISVAREYGQIQLEQLPGAFAEECICKDRFLEEVNQNIHMTNIAMGLENKVLFSRHVIGEQMQEVGEIVQNLAQNLPVMHRIPSDLSEYLMKELRKKRVLVRNIAFYEKYDGKLEIHLRGRTWRGRFVTTREVADMLSDILKCSVKPEETCRKFFPDKEEEFIFEECAGLRVETGISRLPRGGEDISGDTFSCQMISEGEMLLALSDGMGSGREASEESEQVMELLEQMTEAGFSEHSAIRLINSLYMCQEENRSFATADIAVLNLYKKECHFLKCGASITYFYHEKELEKIEGEALPIGVMNGLEPFMQTTGIEAGDYVIMMTDGVADCFHGQEEELEEQVWEQIGKRNDPQKMSQEILSMAHEKWGEEPGDDMSVLVVKLYKH